MKLDYRRIIINAALMAGIGIVVGVINGTDMTGIFGILVAFALIGAVAGATGGIIGGAILGFSIGGIVGAGTLRVISDIFGKQFWMMLLLPLSLLTGAGVGALWAKKIKSHSLFI